MDLNVDLNDIRSLVTVILFLVFLGIVAWAWSARRSRAFEAAAQQPFAEDARDGHPAKEGT